MIFKLSPALFSLLSVRIHYNTLGMSLFHFFFTHHFQSPSPPPLQSPLSPLFPSLLFLILPPPHSLSTGRTLNTFAKLTFYLLHRINSIHFLKPMLLQNFLNFKCMSCINYPNFIQLLV